MGETEKTVEVKGWEVFTSQPIIRLLANVMDPLEEHDESTILAALADKYEVPYQDTNNFRVKLHNVLVPIWHRNDMVDRTSETVFEIPIMGSVRVTKTATVFTYEKDGLTYYVEHRSMMILEINNKLFENKPYDKAKVSMLEGEIRTLFERYEDAEAWSDYYDMVKEVFNKGRMSRELFSSACDQMARQEMEKEGLEYSDDITKYARLMTKKGRFIFDRYMEYLWVEENENKPLMYRLGIDSFIVKHLSSWLEGQDFNELRCNLYTDEHKKIKEIFDAQEPSDQYLYKLPVFLNLKVLQNW